MVKVLVTKLSSVSRTHMVEGEPDSASVVRGSKAPCTERRGLFAVLSTLSQSIHCEKRSGPVTWVSR